jgi:Fic family protein
VKIPHVPPATDAGAVDPAAVARVIGARVEVRPEPYGRYLHWDELRHRPAPGAVSNIDLWHAIRLARTQVSTALPLVGGDGRAFTLATTPALVAALHEAEMLLAAHASEQRYAVLATIDEAITSSQIEGATTSHAVATEMLLARRPPRSHDERMIHDNFQALEWIRAHAAEALTPAHVIELQGVVAAGTLEPGQVGRLRRADEAITVVDVATETVLYVPPPAAQLPERLAALCAFANAADPDAPFVHPIVRSILVHLWLAYDHPFVDGNGRTARALFYWSMLRRGYGFAELISISTVIKRSRAGYDRAFLHAETDGNDATYFVWHQLEVVRAAAADAIEAITRGTTASRALEARLPRHHDLNPRQLAVVEDAAAHPDAAYTIEAHQHAHRVVYQTARTDLLGLAERGYLALTRPGRRMVFRPARTLAARLGRSARGTPR